MILAKDIHKKFGEQEVLKGITAEFYRGKTNLIIGRSGAGKTVLLKILVGLVKPSFGKVLFDDIDYYSLNKVQMRELRMKIGMLFQGSALFDSMNVEENIRFPMDMFTKMSVLEKRKQVDYCLERVNLSGVNLKYPSELSGGMQKRVGIARAIVLNPKYLFCDEPNSGLDPKTSIVIDDLILDITHDMNSVMEIGENIFFIHQGKLEWNGNNKEVLTSKNEILDGFIFASPFLQGLKARMK